jgi:hypothetical protein
MAKQKIDCLLIGAKYKGDLYLPGTFTDVINLKKKIDNLYNSNKYILEYYILVDTHEKICGTTNNITYHQCTGENIRNTLNSIIKKKPDYFYFQFSGHGSSVYDNNNDEKDGMDECICPCDFIENRVIRDDELQTIFSGFNENTNIRVFMDCCHSGTMLDLKYKYENNQLITNNSNSTIKAKIISISGCRDKQVSLDIFLENKSRGAFTYCLLSKFNIESPLTLVQQINLLLRDNKFYSLWNSLNSNSSYQQAVICSSYDFITSEDILHFTKNKTINTNTEETVENKITKNDNKLKKATSSMGIGLVAVILIIALSMN